MAVIEVWCASREGTAIPGFERLCDDRHPEFGLECTGAGNHLGNHMAVNGGFRPKWPNKRGFRPLLTGRPSTDACHISFVAWCRG